MPERGMAGGSKLEHEQQRWRVAACGGDARWLRGVREMVRSLLTPDHLCKRWLASLIPVPRIEPSHEVRVRCRCNTVGVEREREHGASRGSLSQVRVAGWRRASVRDPVPHPAWPARNVGGCRAQPRPCALQGQARARGDRVPGWRSAAAPISRHTCNRGGRGGQNAECRGKGGQKMARRFAARTFARVRFEPLTIACPVGASYH